MAYVSANEKGGLPFNKMFSDFLRKQPYYQCGVAMNDTLSNQVKTAKFTSSGELQKNESEDVKEKNEHDDQSDNEEDDS